MKNQIREVSEPGGSIIALETATAPSIPESSTDWMIGPWQEEERQRQ